VKKVKISLEVLIMFETFLKMMSYPFMVRAIIVGVLVSLCAALLGVSLVLKRYSMIGDGLSHVGFGALAVATALNAAPLSVAIPVVVVAAFFLLRLSQNSKIKGDAAIAIISTASLAIGVMSISLSTGANIDVFNYMFGSILAMNSGDVTLSVILAAVVMVLYVFFYSKIFAVTFDENFAKATGTKAGLYNMLIAFLTAITIVLGMRLMGALLISALIIFPSLTSMRIFKNFRSVVISSAILSVVCFLIGITVSYVWSTPAGASVVCVYIVAFLVFSLIGQIHKRKNVI
jgi:zinc transport system permease protein